LRSTNPIDPPLSGERQRYRQGQQGNNRYMMRVTVIMYTGKLVIIAVENLHTTIRQWVDADRNALGITGRQDRCCRGRGRVDCRT
jgi:hypothetical protein